MRRTELMVESKLNSHQMEILLLESENLLNEFFSDYDSRDCNECLWEMLKGVFRRDTSNITDIQAMDLVGFYERVQEAIEAARIVHFKKE